MFFCHTVINKKYKCVCVCACACVCVRVCEIDSHSFRMDQLIQVYGIL